MSISPHPAEAGGAGSDPTLISFQSAGAARVVGAAQGAAWRRLQRERLDTPSEEFRRAARWVLRRGARLPASALSWEERQLLARDLQRHFPHFSERAQALARAAGRLNEWGAFVDPNAPGFGARLVDVSSRGLRCHFPRADWMVRDVELAGGRRSLGISAPLWPAQFAGVNDAGLCGVALVEAPIRPARAEGATPVATPPVFAPAWLLLDQCLERCDRVERALRWCERRPGGGRGALVFADATGRAQALAFEGNQRARVSADEVQRRRGEDAYLEIGLDPAARGLALSGPGLLPRRYEIAAA